MPMDGIKVNLGNAIKATFPKTGELHDLAQTGWKLQPKNLVPPAILTLGRNENNICHK